MSKKSIVARAEVVTGREAEFLRAVEPLIAGTRAEQGCISYTLYRSVESPSSFVFYEEYRDDRAMAAHAASSHLEAFHTAAKGLLAAAMIVEKY